MKNYLARVWGYWVCVAAGLIGRASSTSPQAGYRQLGGLVFYSQRTGSGLVMKWRAL